MGTGELSGKPGEMLGVTCDGLASHPGGVAILLVASCYGNRDKLRRATRLVCKTFFCTSIKMLFVAVVLSVTGQWNGGYFRRGR